MNNCAPSLKFYMHGVHNVDPLLQPPSNATPPPAAIRQAALQGIDIRNYSVSDFTLDPANDRVILTLQIPVPSDCVTLPTIPYTEENYHPLHGPAGHWWQDMEMCRQASPYHLSPETLRAVSEALGGLDLTAVGVLYIGAGTFGYQITVALPPKKEQP